MNNHNNKVWQNRIRDWMISIFLSLMTLIVYSSLWIHISWKHIMHVKKKHHSRHLRGLYTAVFEWDIEPIHCDWLFVMWHQLELIDWVSVSGAVAVASQAWTSMTAGLSCAVGLHSITLLQELVRIHTHTHINRTDSTDEMLSLPSHSI